MASGQDLRRAVNEQVFLIAHPEPRVERVTNDFSRYFGVSVSGGEEAIAAMRLTRLANLWLADAAGGEPLPLTSITNPEDSPFDVAVAGPDQVVFDAPRDQTFSLWTIGAEAGEPRALTTGTLHLGQPPGGQAACLFDRLDDVGIHIWRVGADGSDLRQLTSGKGEQVATVSRDGRLVAFFPYDAPQSVSLLTVARRTRVRARQRRQRDGGLLARRRAAHAGPRRRRTRRV